MSNFAITYYGEPEFESPEDGAKYQAKWRAWAGGIGDAFVNPDIYLGRSKTVSSAGVSDDSRPSRLAGVSIVKADSLDAALEMAKGCPHLEHGTLDVAEVLEMPV